MMNEKSVAETLFEEEDAVWGDETKPAVAPVEPYNPPMSLTQLRAPTPDGDIDKLTHTLVVCEAVTPAGTFEYHMLVSKLDDLVFESGPALTTRMVRSKLLTAEQAKAYRDIVAE